MTPTHERMLELLKDGKPHSVKELRSCLYDPLSDALAVRSHIYTLRKELEAGGSIIVQRSGTYTLVTVEALADTVRDVMEQRPLTSDHRMLHRLVALAVMRQIF